MLAINSTAKRNGGVAPCEIKRSVAPTQWKEKQPNSQQHLTFTYCITFGPNPERLRRVYSIVMLFAFVHIQDVQTVGVAACYQRYSTPASACGLLIRLTIHYPSTRNITKNLYSAAAPGGHERSAPR